jgi:hypothetical protein
MRRVSEPLLAEFSRVVVRSSDDGAAHTAPMAATASFDHEKPSASSSTEHGCEQRSDRSSSYAEADALRCRVAGWSEKYRAESNQDGARHGDGHGSPVPHGTRGYHHPSEHDRHRNLTHGRCASFASRLPPSTLTVRTVPTPVFHLPSPGSPIAQPLPRATRRQRLAHDTSACCFAPNRATSSHRRRAWTQVTAPTGSNVGARLGATQLANVEQYRRDRPERRPPLLAANSRGTATAGHGAQRDAATGW